jgi:two-component system sensor histidine kinase/response regulator
LKSFSLNKYWSNLIGDDTLFAMENRIFNAVCLFSVFTASINAIVSICLGLIFYGIVMFLLIGVLFFCYYLSRYHNKLDLAVGIAAISFNLLCGGTYFDSLGASGVNLLSFTLIIFILTVVSSRKQFWILIPLNVLLLFILLALEYYHPEWVKPLYATPRLKLLDLIQTVFEVILTIILITLFIKRSYTKEKELAQARLVALEESNETKNKLFSIVSHDLKAPLASIENYLSLLNEIELSAEEKVVIEKSLLATTRQTSAMLHNILLWSKNQMEGVSANLIPLDVHQILKHTIQFQQHMAKEKGIELNYHPNMGLKATADPDMLQLIVRNLLNNAIKFSSPGDKIEISTKKKDQECLLSISDNGIGISENKKSKIFSLQSKGTYGTNNEMGVGLGLKMAKAYVEMLHGKIWFESTEGMGTTFFVSLPQP